MWDEKANGYAVSRNIENLPIRQLRYSESKTKLTRVLSQRGEGVASVVLKTLSAALADGDHIDAIIRETGVNRRSKDPR